jgi:hypothetical protein
MPDNYRSEDEPGGHQFLVLLYTAEAHLKVLKVEASTYADAVFAAAPGNDVIKIEVIAC